MRGRYVPLPRIWADYEVCQGCYIELPPSITYIGSRLCNNSFSGWWSVFLTEWVACAAAFLVLEVYDQYRLWFLPPSVRTSIRALYLSVILGGGGIQNEVISLLDAMDQVHWNAVPIPWIRRQQGTNPSNRSPGCRTPLAGDYVFFYPWEQTFITKVQAAALQDAERAVPLGHPRGYVMTDGYYHPHE